MIMKPSSTKYCSRNQKLMPYEFLKNIYS